MQQIQQAGIDRLHFVGPEIPQDEVDARKRRPAGTCAAAAVRRAQPLAGVGVEERQHPLQVPASARAVAGRTPRAGQQGRGRGRRAELARNDRAAPSRLLCASVSDHGSSDRSGDVCPIHWTTLAPTTQAGPCRKLSHALGTVPRRAGTQPSGRLESVKGSSPSAHGGYSHASQSRRRLGDHRRPRAAFSASARRTSPGPRAGSSTCRAWSGGTPTTSSGMARLAPGAHDRGEGREWRRHGDGGVGTGGRGDGPADGTAEQP